MRSGREQWQHELVQFLRTIQKPAKPIEDVGITESLVASGLIDSLAIVQIVLFLENTYGINFSEREFDPEQLASIASILDLIEESHA